MSNVENNSIGILGGTFDPPHFGHLALARAAIQAGDLSGVLLIPARIPPLKIRPDISTPEARLAMTRLLAEEDRRLSVCDIELRRSGTSYTVDTLRELKKQFPESTLRLIIGADNVLIFHTWREPDNVVELAPPLVADRPGSPLPNDLTTDGPSKISLHIRQLLQAGRFIMPASPISSTEIRKRIKQGLPCCGLLPKAIFNYLKSRNEPI